jgi:uncharacterized protein YndB with AHSA1/START domain
LAPDAPGARDAAGRAIRWRLHLASPPASVYALLATDAGRARFWAESAVESDGRIEWRWPGGFHARTRLIETAPPHRYAVEYYGGSRVTFILADDGAGGTDLTLTDEGVADTDWAEVNAGWVSVLMALKAAADHGIDLRNHDESRTWTQGYADN